MMRFKQQVLGTAFLLFAAAAFAEPQIHCGEIFEDEFTKRGEYHDFLLDLEPGTKLDVVLIAVGTTLRFHAKLIEPTGNVIYWTNEVRCCNQEWSIPDDDGEFVSHARLQTEPLSSRGTHTIRVYNWSAGVYSLYVNCVMRDGRELKAGTMVDEPAGAPPAAMTAAAPQPAAAAPSLGNLEQLIPNLGKSGGGDVKDQLKTAAVDFAKKKAMGWLTNKLAQKGLGKLMGGGGPAAPAAEPSLPVQQPAPRPGAGIAQELLVAAVAPAPQAFTPPPAAPQTPAPVAVAQPAPQPAAPAAQAPQPASLDLGNAPNGVTLYADKDFIGAGESFLDSDANLKDNAIGNDNASSLRVSYGCAAILYSDANFEGKSIQVTQDVVNLRDTRIGNDSVSSIRVRCQGTAYY